ncbi:hypothetical protein BU23DRAFT_445384, partial [Bimuria novae-zelandiae CBS 107.79]
STFQSGVYARLDNPLISLFRFGIRVLQLVFAVASGTCYAIELSEGHRGSAFIYSQVVFGLTFITLVIDAVTLRSYRLTFLVESTICILWLALFGVFCNTYLSGQQLETEYQGVNIGRMKAAVWLDMIKFWLWLASALFSTVMCCSGVKSAIKGNMQRWRMRQSRANTRADGSEMEEGIFRDTSRARGRRSERLPLYEEIVAAARAG